MQEQRQRHVEGKQDDRETEQARTAEYLDGVEDCPPPLKLCSTRSSATSATTPDNAKALEAEAEDCHLEIKSRSTQRFALQDGARTKANGEEFGSPMLPKSSTLVKLLPAQGRTEQPKSTRQRHAAEEYHRQLEDRLRGMAHRHRRRQHQGAQAGV